MFSGGKLNTPCVPLRQFMGYLFFFFYFKIQKITYFCGSAVHCAMTSGSF